MWRNSQLKDSENNRIVFIDTIIDDVSNQSMFGPSKRKKQLFGLIKKVDTLDKLIVTTLSSVATYW